MMTDPAPHSSGSSPKRARNSGVLFVIGGLCLVLLGVGILVVKGLSAQPAEARASGPATGSVGSGGPAAGTKAATTENVQATLERALTLQRSGNFAESAALLRPLAEREVTDQGVRVVYAQSLLGLKQYAEAYEQYQAALALFPSPGSPGSAVEKNPAAAQLHFEAGTCANQAGQPQRAIEHYSMAQTLDAAEAKYPMYLGMMQARAGDDPAAIASLIRATKIKPELAEAWGTLAEIELRRNNNKLALQHIAEARRLQPQVTRWRLVEARGLNRTGDADRALELLSALDAAERSDKAVLSLKAESYGLLKRGPEAASMYVSAADAYASDSELNYQAALWLDRTGQHDKAKKYANIAATLGHPQAKAMLTQAP